MSGPFGSGSFGTAVFSSAPLYTTKELIDSILRDTSHGNVTVETAKRRIILGMLNNVYAQVTTLKHWDWLYQTLDVNLMPPYRSGTIDLVSMSQTVNGIGTMFSANAVPNNVLVLDNRDERYMISTVNSQTQLTLEARFTGASQTEVGYQILKPIITAPANLEALRTAVLQGYYELDIVGPQEFRRIQSQDVSLCGIPRYITEVGRRAQDGVRLFEVYPAPDQAYVLQLDYGVLIQKLEDTESNYPLIPDRYRTVLYMGAMAQFQMYLSQPDKSVYYESMFRSLLTNMQSDNQLTDSRLIFEPRRNYRARARRGRTFRTRVNPKDFARGD